MSQNPRKEKSSLPLMRARRFYVVYAYARVSPINNLIYYQPFSTIDKTYRPNTVFTVAVKSEETHSYPIFKKNYVLQEQRR